MSESTVFTHNRTQNVRIPAEARFAGNVKKVTVRVRGHERIITPIETSWDSFFISDQRISDDFSDERASQTQANREEL